MASSTEILIDHLDKTLDPEKSAELENSMRNDNTLDQEYQYLLLARETIRLDAINQKVFSVRHSIEKTNSAQKTGPAVLRSFQNTGLRVAAAIILLLGVAVFYKYVTVNGQSVYDKQFIDYELSNSRGANIHHSEEIAYQDKNWNEVISNYQAVINPSNKQTFLAGMAEMQLSRFPRAVSLFENILNSKSGDNSFHEEAEYYSFLAYLRNHEEVKAIQMIDKIKSNPNHTYYPFAARISDIDLKVIEIKK
jgi:tetratricopeptide (TPR) repeat protein